jgi:hypothetical protein
MHSNSLYPTNTLLHMTLQVTMVHVTPSSLINEHPTGKLMLFWHISRLQQITEC